MRGKPSLAFGQLEFWGVAHWAASAALTALAAWVLSGYQGGWQAAASAVLVAVGKGAYEWLSDNTGRTQSDKPVFK